MRDLGSTNGIKLNGRTSRGGRLNPGDEITLGLSRLTFEQE
ncbi:MAG: FHA domain-containing protein [Thermoleophilaceae bacterium]